MRKEKHIPTQAEVVESERPVYQLSLPIAQQGDRQAISSQASRVVRVRPHRTAASLHGTVRRPNR